MAAANMAETTSPAIPMGRWKAMNLGKTWSPPVASFNPEGSSWGRA